MLFKHETGNDIFTLISCVLCTSFLALIIAEILYHGKLAKINYLIKNTIFDIMSFLDYYQDVLNLSLIEFPKPDVIRIAEKGDLNELGRLLQLILGKEIFIIL